MKIIIIKIIFVFYQGVRDPVLFDKIHLYKNYVHSLTYINQELPIPRVDLRKIFLAKLKNNNDINTVYLNFNENLL